MVAGGSADVFSKSVFKRFWPYLESASKSLIKEITTRTYEKNTVLIVSIVDSFDTQASMFFYVYQ
ncbi:hypothetical protein B1H38_06360 [Leptospira borgpetersenii serovar Ballum]|nr:hypothetical protein B1H38_06360 [Leptospira borgpetersenii serovar Ballum]